MDATCVEYAWVACGFDVYLRGDLHCVACVPDSLAIVHPTRQVTL